MGTSASSNGPGAGVPFDPPWLDDIAPLLPMDGMQPSDQGNGGDEQEEETPPRGLAEPSEIAPARRFQNARLKLRAFARAGDEGAFRKAMGHYSRAGMGGARRAAKRMGASTRSATNLYGVLQSARDGTDPTINEWVRSLKERSATAIEIVDEIIRHVAPSGGSPEEDSCRDSMAQAMEDLLEQDADVDLLQLDDDKIWTLIESFLSYEAFNRLCWDIGQLFENSALSPLERVLRMNEMRDYLKAELSTEIGKLRQSTPNAVSKGLQEILQTAVENTFQVYEGSL